MEDLFNIDDYDNDEQYQEETRHDHLIQPDNTKIEKVENLEKIDKKEEKIEVKKQEIEKKNTSDEIILPEKKQAKAHAVDDQIDIKEYDKISDLALTFPFELDIFQKRSIIRLENHQNVLVCAHTSSGKTVVAEYAIALGKKHGKRVFYTSPIKALSNQKYREFKQKFEDVGILTGDVSIKADAQCVIMTTEILQNSLYKNSEMLNMVDWVIFDEVHYINDNERGHVWEEILILLPPTIGIVMLSATVPNYLQFAKWVGRIKNTTIYTQNTLKRVVPLEHKIYINTKQIFIVKDKFDKVNEVEINNAIKELRDQNDKNYRNKNNPKVQKDRKEYETSLLNKSRATYKDIEKKTKDNFNNGYNNGGNGMGKQKANTVMKLDELIAFLKKSEMFPTVIFVFSIKKIDEYSRLVATQSLVSPGESARIIKFFDKCMSILREEDRQIYQIQLMRTMLPMGIGVHHAGLLPILKETIEILYSKGLVKVLFATTSFSIGLNMPTRTVVFTEIEKYNDEKKVTLSTSEYLQMCGRAGRRGIDQIGHIFILMGDKQNPPLSSEVVGMMSGQGDQVESKFRLSYKTIISFISRNIKNIMEFFKESYLENNKVMIMPETLKKVNELKKQLMDIPKIECINHDEDVIADYFRDTKEIQIIRDKLYYANAEISGKITAGRIITVYNKKSKRNMNVLLLYYYNHYNMCWCLAVDNNPKVVQEYEQANPSKSMPRSNEFQLTGICGGKYYNYFEIPTSEIVEILDFKINVDVNNFDKDPEDYYFLKRKDLDKTLNDIIDTNSKFQPKVLDYLKLTRGDLEVNELLNKKKFLQQKLQHNKVHECYLRNEHFKDFEFKNKIQTEYTDLSNQLKEENLKHFDEFNTRLAILKKLGYADSDDQISIKGKAAREIHTTCSVMISELLMSNILDKLSISETIAFLAGFALSKNDIEIEDPQLSEAFSTTIAEFSNLLENLKAVEQASNFEENKYNRRATFSVSKAIHEWINGATFKQIVAMTDLEEGKLFTMIMRLYLFLDEIRSFYDTLGNAKLAEKYVEAKKLLIKDVLATKSLYIQDQIDIENEV